MDERCKSCLRLCKRLDADNRPERYDFVNLTVEDILSLADTLVREYPYWQLCVDGRERSTGDQLIFSFKEKNNAVNSLEIYLLVLVHRGSLGTSLCFLRIRMNLAGKAHFNLAGDSHQSGRLVAFNLADCQEGLH